METNLSGRKSLATTPDYGVGEDPNPGEARTSPGYRSGGMSAAIEGYGAAAVASLSNKPIEAGAQVGIMRNLEFSAGGRAHRISTGPYTKA
ncbi:MAG: hypothetical protein M3014_13195 [Chloroflexota bacterium]|nr:hypothetical protein [Chloroflexota bacterium]